MSHSKRDPDVLLRFYLRVTMKSTDSGTGAGGLVPPLNRLAFIVHFYSCFQEGGEKKARYPPPLPFCRERTAKPVIDTTAADLLPDDERPSYTRTCLPLFVSHCVALLGFHVCWKTALGYSTHSIKEHLWRLTMQLWYRCELQDSSRGDNF